MTKLVQDLTEQTARFAIEILGMPIPETPTRLNPSRKAWAISAVGEELLEFGDAQTLEDEADALIDLAYFALGRIVEMGLAPRALFEEVHAANMMKKRGELSKRPGSMGYDAYKPEGWMPPFLEPLLKVNLADVLMASRMAEVMDENPANYLGPKIIILGHGRHGKDEAANYLAKKQGLRFVSSSMFCAEKIVLPAMQASNANATGLDMIYPAYKDAAECFADRANYRAAWFNFIAESIEDDQASLGRAIFEEHDIYVGVRSHKELHGLRNAGLPDLVLWIDRSEHVPAEPETSCTVQPWMADFVVDNNRSLEDLHRNLDTVFDTWMKGNF